MATKPAKTERPADEALETSYWTSSKTPLQILVFLLPLILFYEAGLGLVLRSEGGIITNKAHETLLRFFAAFGVNAAGGLLLGGVAIVVVLVIWHILTRERWTFTWRTTGLMVLESLLLVLPILVIGRLIGEIAALSPLAMAMAPPATDLTQLGPLTGVVISVGAGLYEELLFRMLMIAAIHTLLVDVGKTSTRVGAVVAVILSSLAFAMYHPLRDAAGTFSATRIAFYVLAGVYFGVIYLCRGFGIVVAVHAFYDILTVLVAADSSG